MNCLDNSTRAKVVSCLIEGCSVRATVRMTGVSKPTIIKLLADLGAACAVYHDRYVRNLKVRRLQADEIWQFVEAKAKNASPDPNLPTTYKLCCFALPFAKFRMGVLGGGELSRSQSSASQFPFWAMDTFQGLRRKCSHQRLM